MLYLVVSLTSQLARMKLEKSHLIGIVISSLPLLVGSGLAHVVGGTSLIGETIGNGDSFTPLELVLQAVVSTVVGSLVVISLFWILHRRGRGAKKLVVAFVVSPIIFFVSLFLGQAFLLVLFKGAQTPLEGFVMVVSIGVSMVSIILVLIDAIPTAIRNVYVAFYGAVFGTFLAATLVTSTMFVLVFTIVAEDYLLTRYSPAVKSAQMAGKIGEDPFDYTRIESENIVVGVGDFIAYSLISSHAFLFFPSFVWLSSMALSFLGIVINLTVVAEKGKILPAIPIPAILGMFPWAAHLATLIYLV